MKKIRLLGKIFNNIYEILKEACSCMNSFFTLSGITALFFVQESTENLANGISEIYSVNSFLLIVPLWFGSKILLYMNPMMHDRKKVLKKHKMYFSTLLVFLEIAIIRPSKAMDFLIMYLILFIGAILCLVISRLTNVFLKEKDETESRKDGNKF